MFWKWTSPSWSVKLSDVVQYLFHNQFRVVFLDNRPMIIDRGPHHSILPSSYQFFLLFIAFLINNFFRKSLKYLKNVLNRSFGAEFWAFRAQTFFPQPWIWCGTDLLFSRHCREAAPLPPSPLLIYLHPGHSLYSSLLEYITIFRNKRLPKCILTKIFI